MSNIEDDIKAKGFIEGYKQIKNNASIIKSIDKDFFFELVDFLLEEREQDKARIKELEEKNKRKNMFLQMGKEVIENSIPKQKVKYILNEIQEEYDKVQEQFDCIWNKKSKDNYERYKLQELSAVQQELGFILGKFEKLLEEGE